MFVILLSYKKPMEEVDKYLEAHSAFLKEQYNTGIFVASGRKIPRTGGVILAKADSKDEINAILENDPFKINGIAEYEVIEFNPSMTGLGYENLKK
jgi:uncharacterized protein YciI